MVNCVFCGKPIEKGTGMLFVDKKGGMFNLCSNKCRMNLFKLHRKPRHTKWTDEYHKEKEIRMKGRTTKSHGRAEEEKK